ncbi:Zn-dependent hydrolase [Micromonospora carbonacea]|uniref:Zn-dependent hydrolase n=1 Tax=Micromonospora carbonacea TaxID=47853 RepID=A0A7H8XNZ0_9ACTN|nr:Zn-dependent hydrolase [Micromonospora carbonacea]MBB5826329.1 allantoate deiminase/N-carbamoyl-L-amino-acid hydrolase [Micromonospora carbonacea]QLD25869.1 Zn-dependent hydrolase [Micromonospora carbonacea]
MSTLATVPALQPARLEETLRRFAALSEPGAGVSRLAYTRLERQAHDLFAALLADLGIASYTDAAGNTIGELAPDAEPRPGAIGTGSHLDSVPHGGAYDGTAGVVAALAVAAAARAGRPRHRPWRFVAFAAEEGARFGQACNGSRIVAGLTDAADLHRLTDRTGTTMAAAMTECGLAPQRAATARWEPRDWRAFVELHIEQGTVLERRRVPIGVVDTVSGSTRLRVCLTGVAAHTGGTPMDDRRDALAAAAECVLDCERLALAAADVNTRITVGTLTVEPGAITVIPGRVMFTVDVRETDYDRQRAAAHAVGQRCRAVAARRGVDVELEELADTPPVTLSREVTAAARAAATALGLPAEVLASGASHDTQQISRLMPAGIVFVPSRGGLSHSPEEFSAADQVAAGAAVLLETMYRLDATA